MIVIDKKRGELLGDLIARARLEHGIAPNEPVTYAGRLDPMAEGVVLLLVGPEEVRRKDDFLGLDKTYSFDVLLGVSTDTHDVLGVIDSVSDAPVPDAITAEVTIHGAAESFLGEIEQAYPAYSSKPVDGAALFEHARAGREVILPTHQVFLRSIQLLSIKAAAGTSLAAEAERLIGLVAGDFRQDACAESWRGFGVRHGHRTFLVASFRAVTGSGFYVRSFARDLGLRLGTVGLAWRIRRERVGP